VSATGSDPNGDALTYAWDLDNDGTFETPGQTATFTAPAAPATLTVRVRATDTGGLSAIDTATVNVIWDFSGFFPPVDNPPTINGVKAGQAVPVKFGLGGDQGLAVLAAGSPTVSGPVSCVSPSAGPGTAAASAGGSSLQYDPSTDQYTWAWKTDKVWAGTCRILTVTLVDGTTHQALFDFDR
jgi:hypothetical protein